MCRSIQNGGRAAPDIGAKLKAMFMTPVLKGCLNPGVPSMWVYLARCWVGR